MVCPQCRTTNPESASVCSQCGAPTHSGETTLPPGDATVEYDSQRQSAAAVPGWSVPGVPASGMRTLEPGAVLAGRYEILQLLGEGGMGAVYRAQDRELDRVVALKVIRPELVRNAHMLKRFKQELILARQITHRNVIRIFDLGHDEGLKFITMEYIEGKELSSILAERGRLPAPEAAGIVLQVCRGLEAAHAEGVVHRDLKPQNIMLDRQDKVRVMDFGVARSLDTTHITRTGALLGTPAYMSPEQAQGQNVDARSDLYGLGVIFYELLTGKTPFEADHPMATLVRRINEKPEPPTKLEPSIPAPIEAIVLKMLATKPEERYQSASEAIAELETLEGVRTGRVTAVAPPSKRMGLPLQILAGFLAVMLGVVGWLYIKQQSATNRPTGRTVTMLVADFTNETKDPIFDGTLEATFSLAMEGASFISTYPRAEAKKVGEQLQPGASRLDEKLARLVALKEGIGVVVTGSVESKGGGYAIDVKAADARTGKALVEKRGSADDKGEVLTAVAKLAAPIRKALGDATPQSVQMAAAETYSSGSLEAAQAYAQAQEFQWAGRWDEAIQSYQRAVQIDPNLGRAYTGLAVAHANTGHRQEATRYFEMALARLHRMSDREKYRTRGAYYLAIRNDQKAIDEFSALVKQFPADDAGRTNLALAYFYSRNISRALEEERRALEIYPRNQLYRNNAALFAMYAGEFDVAVKEAAEVLKLSPVYAKAYVAQALSELAKDRTAEAVATYEKLAGVSDRGASLAAMGLADIALYEGRDADAIALLEKGVAQDLSKNSRSPASIKLAAIATAHRSPAAALDAANRALETSNIERTMFEAARVLMRHGRGARAKALAAEMAGRLEPEPQAYAKLLEGEALLAAGNPRGAIGLFYKAQEHADTWLGRFDLGRAYLELGKYAEASSELDICIRRRGEATAVFFDDVPTYRYFPAVYYYLGLAQEGLKSRGAAESYHKFLTMKSKATDEDPLVADARRRLR